MSKYKILLFDADATLMDFHRSEKEAVKECLEFFNLPSDDSVIAKYSEINSGYWKMLERGEIEKEKLYPARWQSLIDYYGFDCEADAISDKYIERLATKSYMLDGALELCRELHGKFRMYIVTNGQKDIQRSRLFPSPIFKYFDGCFISEDIGFEKPSIKFFDAVRANIPDYYPDETIIIGDSLTSDMQGGINAGIDTCWYNPTMKELPDNYKVTFVVKNFDEMADILLN
jgi:2-haloacid dehalogenase